MDFIVARLPDCTDRNKERSRFSRAGQALEDHVEQVLVQLGIRHTRTPITEHKSKTDFIFPGAAEYHDPHFDPSKLTILGVKTTCSDRWRQILAEADRIPLKHLLTLQPAISVNQTTEMLATNVQLVVPQSLHATFQPTQQEWLLNLRELLSLLRERQATQ
jgi:hypothetical protein